MEDGENAELNDQREVKNLYPLLMQRNGARDTWNKAGEERRNLESRHQGLDMNVLISHNSLPYVNQKDNWFYSKQLVTHVT